MLPGGGVEPADASRRLQKHCSEPAHHGVSDGVANLVGTMRIFSWSRVDVLGILLRRGDEDGCPTKGGRRISRCDPRRGDEDGKCQLSCTHCYALRPLAGAMRTSTRPRRCGRTGRFDPS